MSDLGERAIGVLVLVALVCLLATLAFLSFWPVSAQSPTPAAFVEWQIAVEYTNPATGQLQAGRVSVLQHRASGECWIVYPQRGIAPASKAVCGAP